jgi:WD40 repeat protein
VVAGDENGNVYLWRDTESIKEHIGTNLTGHAAPLSRLQLTQDDKRLLSIAGNDHCLFQWKVAPVEQKIDVDAHKREKKNVQIENKIVLDDDSLINELNFCFQNALVDSDVETSVQGVTDNGILIRGCNNSAINRLNAKLNFEFEEQTWKRPPAVALVLDHIYGVQTSDRRHTVIYMHFHSDKPV